MALALSEPVTSPEAIEALMELYGYEQATGKVLRQPEEIRIIEGGIACDWTLGNDEVTWVCEASNWIIFRYIDGTSSSTSVWPDELTKELEKLGLFA